MHISGKKGILISDEKRNMLAAANKKKTEKKQDKRDLLNVADILEFAEIVDIKEIEEVIGRQIAMNTAISEEGLRNHYGAE